MSKKGSVIFAVVLAAGSASRYGSTKQLADLDGEPLVRHAAKLARQVCADRTLLVVGHDAIDVTNAADGECEFVAVNDHYGRGLGSSLGLAARVLRGPADALLLLLADQPAITAAHLDALISRWDGEPDQIVATAYSGTFGAPALLPEGCFDRLAGLSADRGARVLFDDPAYRLESVAFEAAAADIDTPADLARLQD